ncbi:MAG: hypothetical protein KDD66_11385, partial [Bdellovibrionales bacterium]|nr:hypothetical protein [Bdellovibrionales bacterium]
MKYEFVTKRDIALLVGSTAFFSVVALGAWFSSSQALPPDASDLRRLQTADDVVLVAYDCNTRSLDLSTAAINKDCSRIAAGRASETLGKQAKLFCGSSTQSKILMKVQRSQ